MMRSLYDGSTGNSLMAVLDYDVPALSFRLVFLMSDEAWSCELRAPNPCLKPKRRLSWPRHLATLTLEVHPSS